MKTIKSFKEKMEIGSHWKTEVYHKIDGEFSLAATFEDRPLSVKQSNSFAFATVKPNRDKPVNSWCNWPHKYEFIPIDETSIAILPNDSLKIVYTYLHDKQTPAMPADDQSNSGY